MSNTIDLTLDIEMSTRAKSAASQLRVLALNLEKQTRELRQSRDFTKLPALQATLAAINNKHSIIAREQMKAAAAIAYQASQQSPPHSA